MSRDGRSIRREITSIKKGIKEYQRETGETVIWFEFDPTGTTKDPVYDEGPSRKWKKGKPVPVVFAYFHEDQETPSAEGFYMVNTTHFTVLLDILRKAGISNPEDTEKHMHDRFSFNGNTYNVFGYVKQGLVSNEWLTVAVDGRQVKEDELPTDEDTDVEHGDPVYD
jgi:hypothetical protein